MLIATHVVYVKIETFYSGGLSFLTPVYWLFQLQMILYICSYMFLLCYFMELVCVLAVRYNIFYEFFVSIALQWNVQLSSSYLTHFVCR